jgi:hypothetical protein
MTFDHSEPKPAITIMSLKALSQLNAVCVLSAFLLSSIGAQQPPPDPKDPKQEQAIVVAPKDEKTVGFATVNPGDVYKLDVETFPIYRFETEGDDDILGENTDAALWQRTINEEGHKQFKVTSGNIHEGHEAVFRLRFKQPQPSGGGGGGVKPPKLDPAYVKAVNCFVKVHTPGSIAAPGILIPAPTQPGKPYTGILQPNTDDEIVTGIEDWSGFSKSGDGLTKDNDLVKVELSWNPFSPRLRPEMVEGKKLKLSLPAKTKAYLPSGQLLADREVEIGSTGGPLAPLAGSARKQEIFIEADSGYTGGEIVLYVDELDKPGANARAMLQRVEIQPEATMVNKVGNLVPSTKTVIPERHFVTPKKSDYITDEYVILEAKGVRADTFAALLQWEGGDEFPGDIMKRRVSRNDTLRTEVIISLRIGGQQLDKLNVWKVWATLTGNVQAANIIPIIKDGMHVGDKVTARYDCTAAISPSDLTPVITATTEVPDLRGNKTVDPPGGNHANGKPLAGGATTKWDMSRRSAKTTNVVADPPLILVDLDKVTGPFPTESTEGNDDAHVDDEKNDPYLTGGALTSNDNPTRDGYTLQGGHIGASYNRDVHFQEFARLEIGGKWYNISDPEDWGITFSLIKRNTLESDWQWDVNEDGDMNDVIKEAGILVDANGDGDKTDDVSRWLNNGSTTNNY